MRVSRRGFLVSTAASMAAPAVMRSSLADAPQFVLKLHHAESSVSSAHDRFLVPWARQVQDQSGGRIRIDLFPSMELGGAPAQLFDQVRDGAADIVWSAPSTTPGRFPRIEAFELPFVPSRRALVSSKAIDDYGRANLADEFRDVHVLCFACSDRGIVHSNQPIHTIEDIKGLRLHVQTRFAGEAMRALGATGVPMPGAQLPLALGQHIVDGCIDPWNVVPTLKLNDLLKAHTDFADVSLSTTTFVLAMNKGAYDRLPRDLKSVIDANSGLPAAGMAGAMYDLQASIVSDMAGLRGDPITTLLPEAVAHWRKATEPVIDTWLKQMKEQKVDGAKLLASVHASLARHANEPEPQPPQPPERTPPQAKAEINPTVPTSPAPSAVPSPPAPQTIVGKPAPAVTKPVPGPAPAKPPASAAAPMPTPPAVKPPAATASTAAPIAPPASPPAAVPQPAAPIVKPPPAAAPPPKSLDIPI